MLFSTRKIYLVVCLLILVVTSTHANPKSVARRSIEATYKAGDVATARKDAKTLLSLMAPDYQFIRFDGKKLSRTEMARNINSWFSTATSLKTATTIKKFSLKKGKAIVIVTERGEATAQHWQTKKAMKLVSQGTAEDTWVQIKGKWLKQRVKTLSYKVFLNGKPHKPVG